MTINTDPSTPVGKVRLLIPDLDDTAPLWTDAQVAAFLDIEGADYRKGAALALETLASNEAMVSKVITTQDLRTDGAAVSAELRQRAALLRAQAQKVDDDAGLGTGFGAFTIRPQGQPDCPAYGPAGWWRRGIL